MRLLAALLATAIAVVLPLAGCSGGGGNGGGGAIEIAEGTPIVLVSIDTLRSDRLPAYGYAAGKTPAIDALRADSVLFARAYSHVPLTLPAHASLLTGQLPPDHGVRDNMGFRLEVEGRPWLPRFLKGSGYATGGFVSAFVLRGATGISSGFDVWEDSIESRLGAGLGGVQRPGAETLRLARPWLESAAEKPFFLFLHLYEPHAPYEPPAAFRELRDAYDGEVAAADAVVGDLVAELRRLDLYDRALVVLLSDHGEGLGDHGEREHGVLLYREALQVPLLVKLPRSARGGTTVDAPVQLVDLFPTIAALLGEKPPEGLAGASLFDSPALAAKRRIYAETFYPRLHFGWSELASLIEDRFHYIHGPDPELYDLAADPAERANVLGGERRAYAALRDALEGYDRTLPTPGAVDPETQRQLAALGYVGGGAAATSGDLPDPKSRLGTLEELRAAFAAFSARDWGRAAEAFRRVLTENPQMLDAQESYARALQELGRRDEALAAYQRAIEISGGAPHLAIAAGTLYLEMGRPAEARSHAELALASDPASANELLARALLAEGKPGEAEAAARKSVEARGSLVGPLLTLARVLRERQRYDEALKLAGQAATEHAAKSGADPEAIRGLHLLRGNLLARLGRGTEAEAAFAEEIRLFPGAVQAYAELAVLYAVEGRGKEAAATLKRMVEVNDSPAGYGTAVRTLRVLGDPHSADALLRQARKRFPGSAELERFVAG